MKLRIAGLAMLLAFAAGCGNSSSDQDANAAALQDALVHSAFADRADKICSQGRSQLILSGNKAFANLGPNQDPSDAAVSAYAKQHAIPILRTQYGRLRQLKPPPGDRKTIGRILDLADQGIAQLQADPAILVHGSGIPPALEQARQRAFVYGLGSCGAQIQRPAGGGLRKLKR
jgi:hypothetical protein